jgi:hypothetical protein
MKRIHLGTAMSIGLTNFRPNILEIGHRSRMRHAFPDTTEFYSTVDEREREDMVPVRQRHEVSIATLPGLARRLADPSFDLVVYPPASTPWSFRGISRCLFRRCALRGGNVPFFRMFGQCSAVTSQLDRGH